MRKVVVLGSTGSLGSQTLEVLKKYKKYFKVIGLAANKNKKLLLKQSKEFGINKNNLILSSVQGKSGLIKLAKLKKAEIIINTIAGISGIAPSKAALKSGKILVLGNKEALVSEGRNLLKYQGKLILLDSEHNAISEILAKFPKEKIKNIYLPCSGGPFWGKSIKQVKNASASDVLAHPTWKMGPKICVESALLINKGIEIIEAHYFFKIPIKNVKVFLERKSKIHGIVEFKNKKLKKFAYISKPNMKEHIENIFLCLINKPIRRNIKEIKNIKLKYPNSKILSGINLVLKIFKKNPKLLKKFLALEEREIGKFLKNEIKLLNILENLQHQLLV